MDFKIGEDIVEPGSKEPTNKITIVIVIFIALLVGVLVFFASTTLFGKKDKNQTNGEVSLDINNQSVVNLYNIATYGVLGKRYDKFVKEQRVTMDNFTNYEKYYYAMMFAKKEDFIDTGLKDNENYNIYSISNEKIKNYMKSFFGDKIVYSTAGAIELTFPFTIQNNNIGTLTYDSQTDSFTTVFKKSSDISKDLIEPFYGKLSSATSNSDNSVLLQERIIYTELIQNKDSTGNLIDSYTLNIYKDYEKTVLITSKNDLSAESLKVNPVKIEDYIDKAGLITYKFNYGTSGYYFVSSSIAL